MLVGSGTYISEKRDECLSKLEASQFSGAALNSIDMSGYLQCFLLRIFSFILEFSPLQLWDMVLI